MGFGFLDIVFVEGRYYWYLCKFCDICFFFVDSFVLYGYILRVEVLKMLYFVWEVFKKGNGIFV